MTMPTEKESKDGSARFYGPTVWRDGHCADADDAFEFASGVHAYFNRETDQERAKVADAIAEPLRRIWCALEMAAMSMCKPFIRAFNETHDGDAFAGVMNEDKNGNEYQSDEPDYGPEYGELQSD
jgi:hypothetical protein